VLGIRLRDQITIILSEDDAIKGGYNAYRDGGYDESKLKLKSGATPTRFTLQRMTYDQRKKAEDFDGTADRVDFVLRACLVAIKDFKIEHPNGTTTDLPAVKHVESPEWGRPIVDPKWMQDAGIPPRFMLVLAAAGVLLSEAAIPFPGNSAPRSGRGATKGNSRGRRTSAAK